MNTFKARFSEFKLSWLSSVSSSQELHIKDTKLINQLVLLRYNSLKKLLITIHFFGQKLSLRYGYHKSFPAFSSSYWVFDLLGFFLFCILCRLINTFTIICKYTRSFCSMFFLLNLDLCCCMFFLNANELVMYLHPVCLGEFVCCRYKLVELLHPRDMNT